MKSSNRDQDEAGKGHSRQGRKSCKARTSHLLHPLLLTRGPGGACPSSFKAPSLQLLCLPGHASATARSQLCRREKLHGAAAALSVSPSALQVQIARALRALSWEDPQVNSPRGQCKPSRGRSAGACVGNWGQSQVLPRPLGTSFPSRLHHR